MNSNDYRQELINLFGDALAKEDQLVDECGSSSMLADRSLTHFEGINMCQMFNVSPNDLFYKWEAYNYSNARVALSEFNLDSALALKAQMQRSVAVHASARLTAPHKSILSLNRRIGSSTARTESEAQGPAIEFPSSSEFGGRMGNKSPTVKVRFERCDVPSQPERPSCKFLPHAMILLISRES